MPSRGVLPAFLLFAFGFGTFVIGIGSDPHGFDREGDGIGCESYG